MKKFLIKDLFDIRKGRKEKENNTNGIRYIQIEDIRNDNNIKLCEEHEKNILVNDDDIIIAWDGAHAGIVGFNLTGSLGSTLGRLRIKDDIEQSSVNTHYIGYYLKSLENYIKENTTGATIPHVSRTVLNRIEVLLPPIEVQNKVVEILDRLNDTKELRQQQIEALSALKQSVYYDMLNSFKKEKFKLKDILKIDTVTMKDFTENPEYYLIGIDNIEKDTGRIINHKKITETSVKGSKHYFNEKHVLYSKIRPYLNKVATPTFEGVCSTDCYPLLVDETKATKEFVVLLLRSQEFVSYANSQSTGANIPRINQRKLLNYNFLMPNLEIQHRIKEKVNKIDQSILLMENSLEQINLLYDSILHKAFNGELFKEDIKV